MYRVVGKAFHTGGKTNTEDSAYVWETDCIDMEYDEDADAYIIPEGWWESIEFGETFSAVDKPVLAWMPLPDVPEVQQPEGHADPIGALGCLPFCPVCGSRDMQWDPETDVSTCKQCGYQNAEEARRNQEKRERNGEITR